MNTIEKLIQRVQRTQHGFTDIRKAAEEVIASNTTRDSLKVADELYKSDVPQARMLATFIFGCCAATSGKALRSLRERVSKDEDWRVQEILAQAFDQYCKDKGYEKALPVIDDWLLDPSPNVRRAVTEGLRIWTTRPFFKEHPDITIELLSGLRKDESDYVRRSVGNALRDISRKHPQLVRNELATWDVTDQRVAQVRDLANQFLA